MLPILKSKYLCAEKKKRIEFTFIKKNIFFSHSTLLQIKTEKTEIRKSWIRKSRPVFVSKKEKIWNRYNSTYILIIILNLFITIINFSNYQFSMHIAELFRRSKLSLQFKQDKKNMVHSVFVSLIINVFFCLSSLSFTSVVWNWKSD